MGGNRIGAFGRRGIKAEFLPVTNGLVALLSGDVDVTGINSVNGQLPLMRKQDFQFVADLSIDENAPHAGGVGAPDDGDG